MKHLLFLLFCFTLTASAFSQKLDTLTTYQWQNNAWQPETRSINTYNSCLVTTTLTQSWDAGSSSWVDTLLTTNDYNSNDQLTQSTTQIWNSNTNSWDNSFRQTISYNNDNLQDSLLFEIWLSNNWQNSLLTMYDYNSDGTTHQIISQIWFGGWNNFSRTTYTYNADKTTKDAVTETWNLLTQNWDNQSRNAYTYNAQGKTATDTMQIWQSNKWKDDQLTVYTYDANGYLVNSLTQKRQNSSWVNDYQINYTNNSDGTIAEEVTQNWNNNSSTWVNDIRVTFSYSAGCTLPLTLLNFTATLNGKAAQLQWITVTEINTKNFVVQRSTDGVHFTNIGTVNAAGNSTQKITYQFSDANALNAGANKVYYRLQMVDNDGKFTYSKIAMITITSSGKLFVVYPNPVKDKLTIISSVSLNKTEARITDATGKIVQKQQLESVQAGVQNTINVAGLNKGVYYLQFVTGSDVQTVKFFKY